MQRLKKETLIGKANKRNKELEDILIIQARSAVIGDMLSMIAHQWRQPLSLMGMVTSKMRLQALSSQHSNKELLNDIAVIDSNINYLSNTIDDFKNFFKPEVKKELHTASQICAQLHTLSHPILEFHNIELEVKLDDTRELFIYGSELIQVLLSLISNAKDAIFEQQKEDGKITILCEDIHHIGEYRLSISDNGGGIPIEVIKTMFDPYISTKGADGTGLGLYMVKTIIEEHFKGTVVAKNIDDGACFTIQFPTTCQEVV